MAQAGQQDGKRLLCHCLNVTYAEVEHTIREQGCRTVDEVTRACEAGGGCHSCHPEIRELIARVRAERRGLFWRLMWGKAGSKKRS